VWEYCAKSELHPAAAGLEVRKGQQHLAQEFFVRPQEWPDKENCAANHWEMTNAVCPEGACRALPRSGYRS
jgi:hypothetical protein